MNTTNVRPDELNYDNYTSSKYDQDIVNSIPFHRELHEKISDLISKRYRSSESYHTLDLGVGTGITSKLIQNILPNATFTVVDFSRKMLDGARQKLGAKNVTYLLEDYAKTDLGIDSFDLIVSVIGLHHQNTQGKKNIFKKVFKALKPGGIFIFGDLMTHADNKKAALNQARHFHHLVEKSTNEKMLTDWAHHHLYLNDLAPIELQIDWLKATGFKVSTSLLKWNTALLICEKGWAK